MASGGNDDETERALAERIAAGVPGITRYVRGRLGPELAGKESVSDIVQSTCRELLRGMPRFDDRGEASFQRWIRQAAEHKIQNRARHWRARRRDGAPEPLGAGDGSSERADVSSPRPSQDAMLHEEEARLARAFRALPPEYRDVAYRSQVLGMTHAEIAADLGRTSEAVRKLVARALARLSGELA